MPGCLPHERAFLLGDRALRQNDIMLERRAKKLDLALLVSGKKSWYPLMYR